MERTNLMAIILSILGLAVMVGGLIMGFTMYETPIDSLYSYRTEKDWTVFWMYFAPSVVVGLFLFGFSEVLFLLDNIWKNSKKEITKTE